MKPVRSRKGDPVHGWVVVDKPLGISSAQVVARVKRAFNAAKVGHGGTLDPLASGILPLALGEATKTVSLVMDGAKSYRFTVRWGEATSTDDREGEVTATSDRRPSREDILAILPRFVGEIEQAPPAFSSIKIDGRRAYDMARAGETVELAVRKVRVNALTLLDMIDADHTDFEVHCGKGFYIRSLARDMALALGTVGHVMVLRRTSVGTFSEAQAISLEKLEEMGHKDSTLWPLIGIRQVLDDIPALCLTQDEATSLRQGRALYRPDLAADGILLACCEEKPVAIVANEGGAIRVVRVFNL